MFRIKRIEKTLFEWRRLRSTLCSNAPCRSSQARTLAASAREPSDLTQPTRSEPTAADYVPSRVAAIATPAVSRSAAARRGITVVGRLRDTERSCSASGNRSSRIVNVIVPSGALPTLALLRTVRSRSAFILARGSPTRPVSAAMVLHASVPGEALGQRFDQHGPGVFRMLRIDGV